MKYIKEKIKQIFKYRTKQRYHIEYYVYPTGQKSKYWGYDGDYIYRISSEKTNRITTILFLKGIKLNHTDKIEIPKDLFDVCIR
jgi:hypothetical protein